ncbi:MAG: 30S ribosomal protein S6 [Deltaproteobacteria bacterium CG_4_8_14_3_um_filter_43_13]|nr:MAG: 30S ribosomal protein S6 [Deltaproteobacteria bacterium CG_4_8_14_3_um_filter_43_13]HCX90348.1 30S ribosomal protein S6 [Deltaproteobacteria bacterium]
MKTGRRVYMKAYETVFITDPDIPEEDLDKITERLTGIVDNFNGKIIGVTKWGKKKLAYRIKKRTKGYYFVLNYLGNRDLTTELERVLKLDDRIIKYLTLKADEDAELDSGEEKGPEQEEKTEDMDTQNEDIKGE